MLYNNAFINMYEMISLFAVSHFTKINEMIQMNYNLQCVHDDCNTGYFAITVRLKISIVM